MWELDSKESWALKNWCFWTVVLEKTLESPLDCKAIQPVNPEGNQSWIFTGRTDAEAPILWLPGMKNWLIWKDPDAGKDWRQKEKGKTEDEMVGWHHPPTGWTWVWASSRSWWWTGKPVVQKYMGSQRVGHDWVTELKYRENYFSWKSTKIFKKQFFSKGAMCSIGYEMYWITVHTFFPLCLLWRPYAQSISAQMGGVWMDPWADTRKEAT